MQADTGQDEFTIKPNGTIIDEPQLRDMIKPDTICCWESMLAGQLRWNEAGVGKHAAELAELPLERLRLCAAQLPPGQVSSCSSLVSWPSCATICMSCKLGIDKAA